MARGGYASGTTVSRANSVGEVERLVSKYGGNHFGYAYDAIKGEGVVVFGLGGRKIRLVVTVPPLNDFLTTETGRSRKEEVARKVQADEEKRRWRSLALAVKAKLVAVEDGISTIQNEFLANILLPSGNTVGDEIADNVESVYLTGRMDQPLMLTTGVSDA